MMHNYPPGVIDDDVLDDDDDEGTYSCWDDPDFGRDDR